MPELASSSTWTANAHLPKHRIQKRNTHWIAGSRLAVLYQLVSHLNTHSVIPLRTYSESALIATVLSCPSPNALVRNISVACSSARIPALSSATWFGTRVLLNRCWGLT